MPRPKKPDWLCAQAHLMWAALAPGQQTLDQLYSRLKQAGHTRSGAVPVTQQVNLIEHPATNSRSQRQCNGWNGKKEERYGGLVIRKTEDVPK